MDKDADIDAGVDRYAVVGHPIAHSRSPQIHRLFAEQTGEILSYEKFDLTESEFESWVESFFDTGGKGLNVTMPHKVRAGEMAGRLTPRAQAAGAANTLYAEGGQIVADNTDGAGLVMDIETVLGWQIVSRRVLILGAGGAVRGILEPLLTRQPVSITLANRTVSRAQQLAADFSGSGCLDGCGFEELAGRQFDLVINATAASMSGELPPLPVSLLAAGARCYDMMYSDRETVFQRWASAHGAASTADGLGMLVAQAAESFYVWRGKRPAVEPVIAALRGAVQ